MIWKRFAVDTLMTVALVWPFTVASGDPLLDMRREIESGKAQPPAALRPKFIAFSFSERCLRDSCGDGSFGVGVNSELIEAERQAANTCAANTKRQGSCVGGGAWRACRTDDKESWAALALYNDYREILDDGEAIGYPDEASARQAALANCEIGLHACKVVWSEQVMCPPNARYGAIAAGRAKLAVDMTRHSRLPRSLGSGLMPISDDLPGA